MKNNIKCVLFDLGQTIIEYNLLEFPKYLNEKLEYIDKEPEEIVDIVFYQKPYSLYERGILTTKEYYEEIKRNLGIKNMTLQDLKLALCSIFSDKNEIETILQKITKNYKVLFVSNLSKIHWEFALSERSVIKKYFKEPWQQILSFKVGFQKPEEEIYLIALERVGVSPENALFIDDKKENVEGFRSIGGNSEQYNCKDETMLCLEDILRKYNVL